MAPGDGGATGKRKRGKRTDEGDSGRHGPGGGGGGHAAEGSPDADARKKPKGTQALTDTTAPPSLPPPPPVHMGPGDGGATGKRKRGKRTDAPGDSGRDSPGGGGGGHATEVSPDADARKKPKGTQAMTDTAAPPSLPPPPPVHMGPGDGGATRKRNRRTYEQGNSGRDGVTEGSPDAPAAPTAQAENVAAPGRISVAHTPNIPLRFESLLKTITSLIPYESRGKSYECTSSQMGIFLSWSKSEMALFFEWSDNEEKATCWMHNMLRKKHFKFTVNAAFPHKMNSINAERAAVAFSKNFNGGDECWLDLKDMLLNMFGSFEGEGLKEYDHLYVFTRVGASVYFRNFKIISLPKADDPSIGLVLTEMNTMFCLKLVSDQGTSSGSNIGSHLPNDQTSTKLILCPVTLYSISNGQMGFSVSHEVDFNGHTYSVLLDNGSYVSSLQELEEFNVSLAEIVVIQPLLKIKHIIGSATNKTHCFVRERCKTILQSLFAEFARLLESGKCMTETGELFMHNVLVRGADVRLYGVELTDYSVDLAKHTVVELVAMVRRCFRRGTIPEDLCELLSDLEQHPLEQIKIAKDDCSIMKAEDRRTLLININSEYMTNVEAKYSEPGLINDVTFFEDCPYADDWKEIMKDNEYMVQVCNVGGSSDEEGESGEDKDVGNASVMQRIKRKQKVGRNTASIKRFAEKKKLEKNKGKLQFSSKRNFGMHMPEKARKDGIIPFRLGMADHILTAYFPGFLRFVQGRMREVKAQSGKFKRRKRPSYVVRGQPQ